MKTEKYGKSVQTEAVPDSGTDTAAQRTEQEMDRRASPRLYLRVSATFEIGHQTFHGEIYNLNAEGAYLKSDTIVPPFAVLKNLRFTLPGDDVAVQAAESLVVWSKHDSQGLFYPTGMGLFFQLIESEQVDRIRKFISHNPTY